MRCRICILKQLYSKLVFFDGENQQVMRCLTRKLNRFLTVRILRKVVNATLNASNATTHILHLDLGKSMRIGLCIG